MSDIEYLCESSLACVFCFGILLEGLLNWTSSSVSIISEVETFSTGEGGVDLTILLLPNFSLHCSPVTTLLVGYAVVQVCITSYSLRSAT